MTMFSKATSIAVLFATLILGLTTALQAAIILRHPGDQQGTEGSSVLFSIETATAEPAAYYQWLRDGEAIPGATAASYAIEAIAMADSGAWFQCTVTVDGVSQTSLEAQLVVYQRGDYDWDGDIDRDDVRQLQYNIGKRIKGLWFFDRWDFKWKKKKGWPDDDLSAELAEFDWNDDNRIDGRDLRLIQQQCSSPHCRVIEPEPPVIVRHPESSELNEGDFDVLRVGAFGRGLHYQWQKNGEDIAGATRVFHILRRVSYGDSGSSYQCVVSNDDGTVTSRAAVVTVNRRADVDFDGDVDSDDIEKVHRNLNRKWRLCRECDVRRDHRINWRDLQAVREQCDIPDCGEESLAVPEIILQPRNRDVAEASPVRFTVSAVGRDLAFQWLRNGTEIAGATARQYTIDETKRSDHGALFQCRISSGDVSLLTHEVRLGVFRQGDFDWDGDIDEHDVRVVRRMQFRPGWLLPEADFDGDRKITLKDLRYLMGECGCPRCQEPQLPVIISEPADVVVLEKSPASFSVEAEGLRLTYQWQVDGVDIPGAGEAEFILAEPQLLDHGRRFSCIVTNAAGSIQTISAELQVEMDVPQNDSAAVGLAADWQRDKAALSWQESDGMRYQIQRGRTVEETGPIGETAAAGELTFIDAGAAYYFGWYYRLATIRDYYHPVSNKVYHAVGPLSEPVFLAAQPAPVVELSNVVMQEDGSYHHYFIAGTTYSGSYRNMDDPVTISVSGPVAAGADGSAGSFSFTPPSAGRWQLAVAEKDGYRSAGTNLQLEADTTAPRLVLHSADGVTTSAPSITISGEAIEKESGLKAVYVTSDRYSQIFGGVFGAGGSFQVDVPVKAGDNSLTVVASDNSGNEATATLSVRATIPALPQLAITSPASGSAVSAATITVAGTIRSSLPPDQIRLLFGGQISFPEGDDGMYSFSFSGVSLREGSNTILVTAQTPYGTVSAQAMVFRAEPQKPVDPVPPTVEMSSARPDSYVSTDTLQISGMATGDADIVGVSVNGVAAAITGSGNQVSFEASLDFNGEGQLDIVQVVTDSNGQTSTMAYTIYHDDGPPTIELTNGGLQDTPFVNTVLETPFSLRGTVSDANLAGFSINDRAVGLLPAAEGDYRFDAALDLVRGEEGLFTLRAWDKAGNSSSKTLALHLDSGLDIEIVSPKNGSELRTGSDTTDLEITIRVPGLAVDDGLEISVDGLTISGLGRSGENVHGTVPLSLAAGPHKLLVVIRSADGTVLARTEAGFSIIDLRLVPLALERQEPANNATGVENNGFIGFYFNKVIDPALLAVEVLETVHGHDYDSGVEGADITSLSKVEMIEVHRDREPVAGGLSFFPSGTMAAFYPDKNLAFGATIYVTLTYGGEELSSTSFTVRPLPTFLQGFVVDQFGVSIEGLTVSIPELERTAISDRDGSFSFGFGDAADETLPPGRYRLLVNPGLTDRRFGSVEFFADIEEGRLNEIGLHTVPVLGTAEPFRRMSSGMEQTIYAAGELTLDLSAAVLTFADGNSTGDVHAQFLSVTEQPYGYINAAAPQWVYNLNPAGIAVSGDVGVRIKMPAMAGSHEYVRHIGQRVILVGLDPRSLQLVPVGVGTVDTAANIVVNEGPTSFQRLDVVGYGLVDTENQLILEAFATGEITLAELISRLTK